MTRSNWALTPPLTGIVARDVVAGLLDSGSAQQVARAAVQEAAARGARVRFLHVVPEGTALEEREASDSKNFTAALRALREFPRVPVTFEVAEGEPGPVFVDRSAEAGILVIAADDPIEAETGGRASAAAGRRACAAGTSGRGRGGERRSMSRAAQLAAYCQRYAACDVLAVRYVPGAAGDLASTV
ncbi:nucleotide-binding universal stress UspA family protein [Kineosphaera limosa]|uniref:UspA family protein n=1 Tax=Kineosphaera limosa NBRC 100340 TaxID=1184609 RepID=K6W7B1_9MICO|nr:universal stress protein [Kineosphaera limosa]NYE03027.1 nucleotide-binding universal stress UspA family protein [Kineosphaera limosa]GAB95080.1 UspA family protein [Kineosphaera limosa NBRC 100340]